MCLRVTQPTHSCPACCPACQPGTPTQPPPFLQALEALRKLRTEKAQEAKELRLMLNHTKTLKDQAHVGCLPLLCAVLVIFLVGAAGQGGREG
jgi:hypothetical protein